MTSTGSVHVEGADIVYDYQGDGPPLLMIAGGGGDAARHARIAAVLAGEYTVISYDRRCNSRSGGDDTADLDMAQQARDAVAVIQATGHRQALIFGNSCGACIGLEIAANHPEMVRAVVAHEAPTMSILPDAENWQLFMKDVHQTYLRQGEVAALRMFHSTFIGFDDSFTARITAGNITPNSEFFLAREFLPITFYSPDLDRIRENRVPMISAAGRASTGAFYARTAPIIAEHTGCPYVEFPGNHVAFMLEPENFADALRHALRGDAS